MLKKPTILKFKRGKSKNNTKYIKKAAKKNAENKTKKPEERFKCAQVKEINNERIMAKRMSGRRRPEGENKGENDKLVFAKEREKPSTFMKQPKQPSEKKKIHECC